MSKPAPELRSLFQTCLQATGTQSGREVAPSVVRGRSRRDSAFLSPLLFRTRGNNYAEEQLSGAGTAPFLQAIRRLKGR